ncbi:DUF3800 domain-containing protein [Actinoplanes sp. NPDC049599]|uniref:DUF3800 domain-containing protein n=1 Tax=Actinoplanes sp. NPDC049599 TaxID=3363903 RepID=UPI00379BCB3A
MSSRRDPTYPERSAVQWMDPNGGLASLKGATEGNFAIGADYSEMGADHKIASFGMSACRVADFGKLEKVIQRSISRHAPAADKRTAEIHLKQLTSGQSRVKSEYHELDTQLKLQAFLLDLARSIKKYVPFSVAGVRRVAQAETKGYRVGELLTEVTSQTNIWLSIKHGEVIGESNKIQLDKGDGVKLTRPTQRGGISRGLSQDFGPDLQPISNPICEYVDSKDSRIVQIADFVAYVAGRLVLKYAKLTTIDSQDMVPAVQREYNFYHKLAEYLNLNIFYCAVLDDECHEFEPWELSLCDGLEQLPRGRQALSLAKIAIRLPMIDGQQDQGFVKLQRIRGVAR